MSPPLLTVAGLRLELTRHGAPLVLLDEVSFSLAKGEILGIVGESGSGKSLTCRSIMRLLPPSIAIKGGRIELAGRDLIPLDEAALRDVRGRRIAMIFQNPSSYLDPVITIGDQIGETLRTHDGLSRKAALEAAGALLQQVGIPDPARRLKAYPHEFSGGMKQRAMIAAALACRPDVLIADEPTTALDVTIQAQILRLLLDLKDQLGLSIILVTHDLSVVSQTCDRMVVMYAGRVMESGPRAELLSQPRHPYSQGLIASQPELAQPDQTLRSIPGQPPTSGVAGSGCAFAPRCAAVQPLCRDERPPLASVSHDRASACHYWRDLPVS